MSQESAKELIEAIEAGKPVLHNFCIGYMVAIDAAKKPGTISVHVDGYDIRGRAEAEFVRSVISNWSAKLDAWDEKQALDHDK